MKNRLLFLLSACLLIGPVFAQGAGPKTASRPSFSELSTYNASVRNAVLSRWKIPFVERTTTIDVTANIGADGKLVSSDIQVSPKIGTSEAVRKSIEEALVAIPAFAAPPGAQPYAAEFRLRAQIGPFLADCYPVKVYVPVAHVDQPDEKIVPSSLEGIKQGIAAWNTFISRRDDKLPPVLALVEQPEQADVRIDALVDATAFGPYISDEANGQQIVRIVTKFDAGGAVQDGYRWRHPGELKQQSEFQLGRMLGL